MKNTRPITTVDTAIAKMVVAVNWSWYCWHSSRKATSCWPVQNSADEISKARPDARSIKRRAELSG
eukprot:4171409-Amphidinium_carterae.1